MMHQALDDSVQTKKYGITESMIQALHYDIVCNKAIIRACIIDSEIYHFHVSFHFLAVTVIEFINLLYIDNSKLYLR